MQKGKLIVIEGGDGSGKATQAQLLLNYLEKNSIPSAHLDFPDYTSFYGKMIASYLRGEYGTLANISPYLVAVLFALDRLNHKSKMEKSLEKGYLLITNRYISSNIAHQGSKFAKETERVKFISWVENLEYKINKLPKEDYVIYLQVSHNIGMSLTNGKGKRDYLKGKVIDIQEADQNYRKKTEHLYDKLSQERSNWHTIKCMDNDKIRTKENIHLDIIDTLQKIGVI